MQATFQPWLSAQTRTAAEILRDFDQLSFPSMSRDATPAGAAKFRAEIREIARRKCELAFDLFELDPDNARLAGLLGKRWALMINSLEQPADVLTEADSFLKKDKLRADVRCEALLARTRGLLATDAAAPTCLRAIGNPFESSYRTPRTPFYYLLDDKGVVVRFAYEWKVMRQILDELKIERS